jgi:hypothetical protein
LSHRPRPRNGIRPAGSRRGEGTSSPRQVSAGMSPQKSRRTRNAPIARTSGTVCRLTGARVPGRPTTPKSPLAPRPTISKEKTHERTRCATWRRWDMGVSVRGNSDLHRHSPRPRWGYATRYKQWPVTCACCNAERQKVRTTPDPHVVEIWAEQKAKNAESPEIDRSHIPPLRIAARYAGGRPRARRRG